MLAKRGLVRADMRFNLDSWVASRRLCSGLSVNVTTRYALAMLFLSGATLFARPATNGVAVTVHPLATQTALTAMRHGGNAIDGAIAAALTLGVVDGHNSGIGGGCFILIRRADGSVAAIDGRETAPAAATPDMYVRDGKADPLLSQTGPLAVATPGALAAYDYAARRFGKLPLSNHLWAASQFAANGFAIDRTYANRLKATAPELRQFEAASAIFLPDDSPLEAGGILRQLDLANTYQQIAKQGVDWFYRGDFAAAADAWMKANGGVLRRTDFSGYSAKMREPLLTTYRDFQIIGFPPPSSGGPHVAQILNILETFDLKKLGLNSADFIHVVTEAMKLAFADRAHWLGDPDFAAVPRGLTAKTYATNLAAKIQMDRACSVLAHGTPEGHEVDIFGRAKPPAEPQTRHTTHFAVADGEGNWVACTATINTSFGSKVVVPGTGVVLNNEMDDFASQPGVANYFGLVGSKANAIAPGKRPLSSMSPTIVAKAGRPVFSVGAAGGPTIISQTVLAIVCAIDFGMPPETALAQGRFHQQWKPDELRIEERVPRNVRDELARRGHKLRVVESLGAAQAIAWCEDGFVGAADPRGEGKSERW
jgi:gamma-glutamyltranspeptidase/glutathione hydrolase